jgi:hypothetical protein
MTVLEVVRPNELFEQRQVGDGHGRELEPLRFGLRLHR